MFVKDEIFLYCHHWMKFVLYCIHLHNTHSNDPAMLWFGLFFLDQRKVMVAHLHTHSLVALSWHRFFVSAGMGNRVFLSDPPNNNFTHTVTVCSSSCSVAG